jgi:hypothetical protein
MLEKKYLKLFYAVYVGDKLNREDSAGAKKAGHKFPVTQSRDYFRADKVKRGLIDGKIVLGTI